MQLQGYTPAFYTQDGTLCKAPPPSQLRQMTLGTAHRGGYKQARLQLTGPAADLLQYYYLLGSWLPVFAPDGSRCWDGLVYHLAFSNGLSYDLTDVFNAVDVVYSPANGGRNNTGFATDATSSARYGRKELVASGGTGLTAGAATSYRDLLLYFHLHSLSAREFPLPAPAVTGEMSLELTAYGWSSTLGWERWVQTGEGAVDVGTQIYNIVAASSFVSAAPTYIPPTGVAILQYRPDQNMTLLQEIERLAGIRDSAGYNLLFQVWNDRIGELVRWGRGRFPAIDYTMDARGVYDIYGAQLSPWQIRADHVIQTPQYQPLGYGIFSDPLDTPTALYLAETELQIDQRGVTLRGKPLGWRDFTQLLRSAG